MMIQVTDFSDEQMRRYHRYHDQLKEAESEIDRIKDKEWYYKKYLAIKVLGSCIPDYESDVPEVVREEFDFDVDSLVRRIGRLIADE
ncbi:hypothetical protein GOV12_01865 [Candidatus Pacearchaeota archaeon]|nr:hypothetical protein [Candidatus Pacearchaeota archaeon]